MRKFCADTNHRVLSDRKFRIKKIRSYLLGPFVDQGLSLWILDIVFLPLKAMNLNDTKCMEAQPLCAKEMRGICEFGKVLEPRFVFALDFHV